MNDKDVKQGPFKKKVFHKHACRAKERLLQNLGKADKTTDENFDAYVKDFQRQHDDALRIQKELRNYYQSIRAMQSAQRSLMETVIELYEPCWDGMEEMMRKSEVLGQCFEDYAKELNNIVPPVVTYTSQFSDLVHKIAKRNRKMLDFDNCRHNLENLETTKKPDKAKVAKAKDQFEHSCQLYESINAELHEELPALYGRRVSFFVDNFRSIFQAEVKFHDKEALSFRDMMAILEKVEVTAKNWDSGERERRITVTETTDEPSRTLLGQATSSATQDEELGMLKEKHSEEKKPMKEEKSQKRKSLPAIIQDITKGRSEQDIEIKPPYQMRCTFKYTADDTDELSIDVGDIIDVLPFDDPEQQEEGWLLGVLNNKKGLFPMNFTTHI